MNRLTTLASFTHPHEAHILSSKLESEGIEVFIKDELAASIYSVAVGGVKVQVKEEDHERARNILAELGYKE